jgi:hypothetical protein
LGEGKIEDKLIISTMPTFNSFQKIALSFPEAVEQPHFDNTSFRVRKKIFATYDPGLRRACLKLNETDQDVFSTVSGGAIYPVPNKWGKQGWTFIQLDLVKKEIMEDALTTAYCSVAPGKLAATVRPNENP